MRRLKSCCTIILLAISASLVQAHDYEDCCSRCQEHADSCRESRSTACDEQFIECMKDCLQEHEPSLKDDSKGEEAIPDKGETPKTNIPDIPDPRKLDELKQRL